ncbi:hypothetical protein L1987_40387 [Smallanthus sonchifolius]|uniref:Uncharacterized protein n=1 Tax=Smallanthus sonchifolius TaxID=185202 RepID=A0ACB9GT25_9ASTR|nr:hypothetical protein L1987_40387 [Smallanthus sonchifolius]
MVALDDTHGSRGGSTVVTYHSGGQLDEEDKGDEQGGRGKPWWRLVVIHGGGGGGSRWLTGRRMESGNTRLGLWCGGRSLSGSSLYICSGSHRVVDNIVTVWVAG